MTKFEDESPYQPSYMEPLPDGYKAVTVYVSDAEYEALIHDRALTGPGTFSAVFREAWKKPSAPRGLSNALARQRAVLGLCDTCQKRRSVGVYAMPGVPISFGYCGHCLHAGAHPYEIVVTNTVLAGGYMQSAPWWKKVVDDTLAYLGKSLGEFLADVDKQTEEMEEENGPGPESDHQGG